MRRRPLILTGVALAAAMASGVTWHVLRASPPPTSRAQSPNPQPAPRVASPNVVPSAAPARTQRRAGNMALTFLVHSDTHFGFDVSEKDASGRPRDPVKAPEGVESINLAAITDMNAIATKPWPTAFGGSIDPPRGVLVSGDLTEEGDPWQWRHFVALYGLKGGDGLLRFPVFEGHGNHDKHHSWHVLDRIRERHGSTHYSFDWDDLFVACLGEAPDDTVLGWLKSELASVGRERPVLVYQHFPLLGPWSEGNWFGGGDFREKLRLTLDGYNVVALFHGHYHASGHYHCRPSASHAPHVHVTGACQKAFEIGRVGREDDLGSCVTRCFGSDERVDAIVRIGCKTQRPGESGSRFVRCGEHVAGTSENAEHAVDLGVARAARRTLGENWRGNDDVSAVRDDPAQPGSRSL